MKITERQYLKALDICKKYKNQISNDVVKIDIISSDKNISIFEMSCRLYNALTSEGIYTFRDLYNFIKNESCKCDFIVPGNAILRIKNCGRKSLNELNEILSSNNMPSLDECLDMDF